MVEAPMQAMIDDVRKLVKRLHFAPFRVVRALVFSHRSQEPNPSLKRRRRKRVGFTGAMTLARYLALPHLLVSSDELAKLGKARRVVMVTAHFSVLPAVLKRIPAVTNLPEPTARHLAREFRLEVCDPPIELRGYQSSLACPRSREDDPAHGWLREMIRSTAQSVAASR